MSDKAEKHLRKLNIHAATSRAVRFPTKEGREYTLHELMQSYAEHHLEDVLGEAEQLIFKESEAYKERTAPKLELQRIGFKHGAYWLLNLLKQRKG